MGVYKEGKNWKVQVYYKDWQGNRKRKQKRGFRTKDEAKEWERDFLQQQSQGVDIEFGNFLEIYYKDMDVRLRENTMYTKRYIIDLKIKPYFEKKILSEITVADVRAWQNELLTYKDKNGKGYSPTYLKTVNCQLTAIFNYAMRYYNLQDNPCRKAGAIGKSKGEPKDFWMQEEFNAFLETVSDKPETRMAFLLLYWTGMRIGELLALTYNDINLEEKTISINKSYQRLKGKDMITQPKTPKSIRVITMPDFLAEEFREYCSHLYGIMKKERLFRFTKSHMEHCMATGIARSGVKRIRLHDLRHSHASMLVDMGVIPLEIAERLGHEKVETTLNTYSHLYPSTQSKLAGLLLIKEFISKLGIDKFLDKTFKTNDPVFKSVLEKNALASQPTVSRFFNRMDEDTLNQFLVIGRVLRKKIYSIQMPPAVILDLDSTLLDAYGRQEGRAFNFHYQSNGYHPLVCYDGMTGDLIKVQLRDGTQYSCTGVVDFLQPILDEYQNDYPAIRILLRGDSGFAAPDLYKQCEENGTSYVIRLKENGLLREKASYLVDELNEITRNNKVDYAVVYGEFMYKAKS